MNDYIKKLRIYDENNQPQDLQIDYNALANLPSALPANGGTADEATKALQDEAGNNIVNTYTTKAELKDYTTDIQCKSIISANDIYTNKNWVLEGKDKNNSAQTAIYANGPIVVPYYIGTISAVWYWEDWTDGYGPYISLEKGNAVKDGYLTDIFDQNIYDILISFDDTTLNNYYSSIAEAGLYLKTNGTLGITNYDVVNSDLYGVNLGVNISIYYVGGGVL